MSMWVQTLPKEDGVYYVWHELNGLQTMSVWHDDIGARWALFSGEKTPESVNGGDPPNKVEWLWLERQLKKGIPAPGFEPPIGTAVATETIGTAAEKKKKRRDGIVD